MPMFHFSAEGTISLHLKVEAETEAQAREIMANAPMQGLCFSCAEGCEGEWSTSGELDCEPSKVRFTGSNDA